MREAERLVDAAVQFRRRNPELAIERDHWLFVSKVILFDNCFYQKSFQSDMDLTQKHAKEAQSWFLSKPAAAPRSEDDVVVGGSLKVLSLLF